jgi:capsular exopolysaccharide synthesis family protein
LSGVQSDHPDALTEVRSNPVVQELEKQLAATQAELRKTEVVYGKNHANVKKLQSQADELAAQLNQERALVLRMLRANYSAARIREQTLAREMHAASDQLNQVAQYGVLKKDVQTNSALYNDLYKQVKEAAIAAGAKMSDMQIVDRARVLDQPTRPNVLLNLSVGFMAAMIGGIFITFIRELFDQRLRTASDVESLTGNSAVLLPAFSVPLAAPERKVFRELQAAEIPDRFLQNRPRSPESEAVRGLIMSIMLARREKQNQVLLVASSFAREGKTTLAINLATSLAQYGSTCLIDADLRRPRVAKAFHLPGKAGLSELLTGHANIDDVLQPVPDAPNVEIITAGSESDVAVSLVASDAMREVVQALRQRFDSVIIDSPPILPCAEGRVLSTIADGVIFVCRSGVTTREAFLRSQELLRKLRAPVLEVVLNGAPFREKDWQYQYDYK